VRFERNNNETKSKSHREMRKFSKAFEKKWNQIEHLFAFRTYSFLIPSQLKEGENEFLSFYEQNKIKFEQFFFLAILFIL
jgi:hypothetical protein